jgi:hypothetical protein
VRRDVAWYAAVPEVVSVVGSSGMSPFSQVATRRPLGRSALFGRDAHAGELGTAGAVVQRGARVAEPMNGRLWRRDVVRGVAGGAGGRIRSSQGSYRMSPFEQRDERPPGRRVLLAVVHMLASSVRRELWCRMFGGHVEAAVTPSPRPCAASPIGRAPWYGRRRPCGGDFQAFDPFGSGPLDPASPDTEIQEVASPKPAV